MTAPTDCPFCYLNWGEIAGRVLREYDRLIGDVAIIQPLNPVTAGHELVIPAMHVSDAADNPEVAGALMKIAAQRIPVGMDANIITSIGAAATQTVQHLHVHIVPRRPGDGLHLPWTGQAK